MGRDQDFMMNWFRRFYSTTPPPPPSRLERREFGFMFFDKGFVQRHLAFLSQGDLGSFLSRQVPSHAYYSSAYYQFPGAPTMDEKSWLGADLIFDLDADHLKGAESLSYGEMLARIKEQLLKLIDDFLTDDLGFDPSELKIAFSGGRGYHIHVADARLVGMKGHERREIVDYIAGTDLSMDWVFPERTYDSRSFKGNVKASKIRFIPPQGSGGWRKKMRTGVDWLLEEMRSQDLVELRQRLPSLVGTPDWALTGMLRDLYEKKGDRDASSLLLEKGRLDCFSDQRHEALFLKILEEDVKPRFASEIDEPVTSDIKRLIRLPGSVHGKTGLRVTVMDREELDDFDPLKEAVPSIYPDDIVKIFVKGKVELDIKGKRFVLEGESDVPTYAAIFLIGRGKGTLEYVPEN